MEEAMTAPNATPKDDLMPCPVAPCKGSMYEFFHHMASGEIKAFGLRCDICELTVESSVPSRAKALCKRPTPVPVVPEGLRESLARHFFEVWPADQLSHREWKHLTESDREFCREQ